MLSDPQKKFKTVKYVQREDKVAMDFNIPKLTKSMFEERIHQVPSPSSDWLFYSPICYVHTLQCYYNFMEKTRRSFRLSILRNGHKFCLHDSIGTQIRTCHQTKPLIKYKQSTTGFCRDSPKVKADTDSTGSPELVVTNTTNMI